MTMDSIMELRIGFIVENVQINQYWGDIVYEFSKEIIEKINTAKCLTVKELRITELALRMYEVNEDILDESTGLSNNDKYELKYKC